MSKRLVRLNKKEDLRYDPKKDHLLFMRYLAAFWYFKGEELDLNHKQWGYDPFQQFKTFFADLARRAKAESRVVTWDDVKDWRPS